MITLYDVTVPLFVKALGGLKAVLAKAEAHGVSADFMSSALAPDMFPFVRQVQIACDNAKGSVARLAQVEVPVFADTESTFAELQSRIDATIAFITSVDKEAIAQAEDVQVTLPYFPGKFMTGRDYVQQYVLANFFFHLSMAYALVRKEGVAIGKSDYMNGLPLQDVVA